MTLKEVIYTKIYDVPADVYLALFILFGFGAMYHYNKAEFIKGPINNLLGLIMGFLKGRSSGYQAGVKATLATQGTNEEVSTASK
jgi:hypothetical protein